MEKDEARKLLSFHSGRNSDIHDPRWENGFLGCLRPFCGELREENFIEVMECIKTLKEEFNSAMVERDMIADIVSIVHLTREWVAPYGMLGGNNILTEEQTENLLTWVTIIENCLMYLLDDDEEDAFSDYEDYQNGEYS